MCSCACMRPVRSYPPSTAAHMLPLFLRSPPLHTHAHMRNACCTLPSLVLLIFNVDSLFMSILLVCSLARLCSQSLTCVFLRSHTHALYARTSTYNAAGVGSATLRATEVRTRRRAVAQWLCVGRTQAAVNAQTQCTCPRHPTQCAASMKAAPHHRYCYLRAPLPPCAVA